MKIKMRPKVFHREMVEGDLIISNESDYYLIIKNGTKKMLLNLNDCSICESEVNSYYDITRHLGEYRIILADDYSMEMSRSSF